MDLFYTISVNYLIMVLLVYKVLSSLQRVLASQWLYLFFSLPECTCNTLPPCSFTIQPADHSYSQLAWHPANDQHAWPLQWTEFMPKFPFLYMQWQVRCRNIPLNDRYFFYIYIYNRELKADASTVKYHISYVHTHLHQQQTARRIVAS